MEKNENTKNRYRIYGYDKDADVEVFLAGHPRLDDAMGDAEHIWKPLAAREGIRNDSGHLSTDHGEPFDWLIVRDAVDGNEKIIGFFD